MYPDDAFERILASLHEAALDDARWPAASALIDEACGVGGNALTVGEGTGRGDRIHFARLLSRGECRQDLVREYFEVHYSDDAGMRRLMDRPEGRPVHLRDLWTEEERRRSPVYNEGWRRLEAQDGLNAHFRDPGGLRLVWSLGDPVDGGWEPARLRLVERLLPHVVVFRSDVAVDSRSVPRRLVQIFPRSSGFIVVPCLRLVIFFPGSCRLGCLCRCRFPVETGSGMCFDCVL